MSISLSSLAAYCLLVPFACPEFVSPDFYQSVTDAQTYAVADDAALSFLQGLHLDPEDDGYREAYDNSVTLAEYIKTQQGSISPRVHDRLVARLVQVGDEMIYWLEWGIDQPEKDWPITWKPKSEIIPIWSGVLEEFLDATGPTASLLQTQAAAEYSRLADDASQVPE